MTEESAAIDEIGARFDRTFTFRNRSKFFFKLLLFSFSSEWQILGSNFRDETGFNVSVDSFIRYFGFKGKVTWFYIRDNSLRGVLIILERYLTNS